MPRIQIPAQFSYPPPPLAYGPVSNQPLSVAPSSRVVPCPAWGPVSNRPLPVVMPRIQIPAQFSHPPPPLASGPVSNRPLPVVMPRIQIPAQFSHPPPPLAYGPVSNRPLSVKVIRHRPGSGQPADAMQILIDAGFRRAALCNWILVVLFVRQSRRRLPHIQLPSHNVGDQAGAVLPQ